MLGATKDFGERLYTPRQKQKPHSVVSDDLKRFVRFIPVWPGSITERELQRKTGFSSGKISALLTSATVNYTLCEDEGGYSLLRRRRSYVD